jgi:capsular exopolysaccharide synthesis family protein
MIPQYQAGVTLELIGKQSKVTKFEDVMAVDYPGWQGREYIRTQVELLKSDALANRVIERLKLAEHPMFSFKNEDSGVVQWIREWVKNLVRPAQSAQTINGKAAEQVLRSAFLRGLEVIPQRDTAIVRVSYASPDPEMCTKIANTVAEEFLAWCMDRRIESATEARKLLDKQVARARIQLEKSEEAMNRFAKQVGIVALESNLNEVYRQLEEINGAQARTEGDRIGREALFKQAQSGSRSNLKAVLENTLIQQLKGSYVTLQAEYEELKSTFLDGYPRVQMLKAKLEDTALRIKEEEERVFKAIENDYLTAVATEEALRSTAKEKKRLALELNEKATQYKILGRDVDTNKQIYQSLLERGKEIEANVGADLATAQVVDQADIPLAPFKPRVKLNLMLAVVLGLIGGIGAAFVLEHLDNSIKRIEEISERYRIPVLASIPQMENKNGDGMYNHLEKSPTSAFSEAIRTAKVSVELSAAYGRPLQSFVITSTGPSEGKSTLAANLAMAFASSGEKVLLIDADLRKPRLHHFFGKEGRKVGLTTFLSGLSKPEEIIQPTTFTNLYLLPAGPIPPNPVELLASKQMRLLLEALCKRFQRVLIDTPPFQGFADVLVLSKMVDGVILVSTLGHTPKDALKQFKKSLTHIKANLLGSIVNRVPLHSREGYYRYRYKYYYYYNYEHDSQNPDSDHTHQLKATG